MKKLFHLPVYFIVGVMLFASCSTDDGTQPDDSATTINNTSLMANLLIRMSEPPTEPTAITCVSINYPINLNIFNATGQQTGSHTISSDLELLLFISNLEPGFGFSIVFPIQVTLEAGNVLQINNLQELQDIILACDASGGQVPGNFSDILTDGTWYVNYFFDDQDETFLFNGYQFSFQSDQTALADNGTNQVNGTWSLTSSSTPDLLLFFGANSPFDELDEDWEILETTPQIIRLKHVSGGDGSVDFLTFGRAPNTGGGTGGNSNSFIENLTSGNWFVNLLDDGGTIETCHYINYTFNFTANQTVTATSSGNTVNGTWEVQNSSSGLDLVLNFQITGGDDPFDDLNDDWDVVEFNSNLIALLDVSGGDGSIDILEFGRIPAENCAGAGDVQALIDVMLSGSWFVASYLDDGNNQTAPYSGYTVDFLSNGTVTADNGSQTLTGSWAVSVSGNGLDLVLDFGAQVPFNEFNDSWDVVGFTNIAVELKDVSGGDGSVDNLRFEKL